MATLGVIGGLGPMATAYFMELVTKMTKAKTDQEHIKTIIYSAPDIPDRTAFILGRSEKNPLPEMIKAGKALKSLGVDVIAIPCVTAHYFHDELEQSIGVKTLNALRETALCLSSNGIKKVGIMATEGTVGTGLFPKELSKQGIECVVPSEEGQKNVTSLIYDEIKSGKAPSEKKFFAAKNELIGKGAQAVILGCTELSLINNYMDTGDNILDVSEVLASAAVLACGRELTVTRLL
ncbi:MAG: amino acid racemase [Clostridia bacterium]|nr:amino acid racemase [Clostridia bacterium]